MGGDLTFFKNLPSNSLPTGKPFWSNAQNFPNVHPRWHVAVNIIPRLDARKMQGKLYNFHFSMLLHTSPKVRV